MDKGGNIASKVEQGMQFYRHFGGTKACPRKHRETQIDGSGIQGIDGVLQFQCEAVLGIEHLQLRLRFLISDL